MKKIRPSVKEKKRQGCGDVGAGHDNREFANATSVEQSNVIVENVA